MNVYVGGDLSSLPGFAPQLVPSTAANPTGSLQTPFQQSTDWSRNTQPMLPPTMHPRRSHSRNRRHSRRHVHSRSQAGFSDSNLTPIGNRNPRYPPLGRASTIEPGPTASSRKRNRSRGPRDDKSINPDDSRSEAGPRTNKRPRRDASCVACFSLDHKLADHPYSNTEEGFLLGCIIHNSYTHTLAECRDWQAMDSILQIRMAIMNRVSKAPIYLRGQTPTSLMDEGGANKYTY